MHFGARGGKLIENINERKSGHKSVSTFSFIDVFIFLTPFFNLRRSGASHLCMVKSCPCLIYPAATF